MNSVCFNLTFWFSNKKNNLIVFLNTSHFKHSEVLNSICRCVWEFSALNISISSAVETQVRCRRHRATYQPRSLNRHGWGNGVEDVLGSTLEEFTMAFFSIRIIFSVSAFSHRTQNAIAKKAKWYGVAMKQAIDMQGSKLATDSSHVLLPKLLA